MSYNKMMKIFLLFIVTLAEVTMWLDPVAPLKDKTITTIIILVLVIDVFFNNIKMFIKKFLKRNDK